MPSDVKLTSEKQILNNQQVMLVPPACDGYLPMNWESTNILKGTWGGVTIFVNSPTYKVYCDDGSPVTLTNGLPFFGSSMGVDYSQNTRVIETPGPSSNSFLITQGTLANSDLAAYTAGVGKFRTAWQAFLDTPTKAMPVIDDYVPKSTGTLRNITGKLIRVTSGSTFATAPSCVPHVSGCPEPQINYVGWFNHTSGGSTKKIWVIVERTSTPKDELAVTGGRIDGNATIFPATGTFFLNNWSVTKFVLKRPTGNITYSGPLFGI